MTPLLSPAEELGSYFPAGSYKFEIRLGKASFHEFFGPTSHRDAILGQRRELLDRHPGRHLISSAIAKPFLDEILSLAIAAETVPPETRAEDLGRHLEPDILVLDRAGQGSRLVHGCVCFPSSWSLAEKMGQPIKAIHAIVPNLNRAIGGQIAIFLDRLKPGVLWTRSNWGLSRHPDFNQHPDLGLSRLEQTARVEEIFFRVEDQALAALPRTGGILFGIRIKVFPLSCMIGTEAGEGLSRSLETMPEEMARYKGFAPARARILELLRAGA